MSRHALTFLVFLAGIALAAGAKENTVTGDTLHHGDLGLSVTKPANWRFLTPKEKRDAQRLDVYKNAEFAYLTRQNPFPPRIIIAKYPEPRVELNPSVAIDRYPLGEYRLKDGLWVAGRVLVLKQRFIDGITVVEPVQATTLGGRAAGYFHIRYTLETKQGVQRRIDQRVWAIGAGLAAYIISATGAQDGSDTALTELDAIIRSIAFDRK